MCEILNVCDENKLHTHVVFVMYAGKCHLNAFGILIDLARVYRRNHTKWSWHGLGPITESTYNQDTSQTFRQFICSKFLWQWRKFLDLYPNIPIHSARPVPSINPLIFMILWIFGTIMSLQLGLT